LVPRPTSPAKNDRERVKKMIITLLMLLSFLQLTGTDDISKGGDDTSVQNNETKSYITYKDIFHTQLEHYNNYIENLKIYFNDIGDITKELKDSLQKYDINDEVDLILMHIRFIGTQLDMMEKRMPELEHAYKLLYSELSLYGG